MLAKPELIQILYYLLFWDIKKYWELVNSFDALAISGLPRK